MNLNKIMYSQSDCVDLHNILSILSNIIQSQQRWIELQATNLLKLYIYFIVYDFFCNLVTIILI